MMISKTYYNKALVALCLTLASLGILACEKKVADHCADEPEDGKALLSPEQIRGSIVFASATLVGSNCYDLWAVLPKAGIVQVTNFAGDETQPAAADASHSLAWAGKNGIFFMDATGEARRITRPGANEVDSMPALTPDGEWVAFVRGFTNRQLDGLYYDSDILIVDRRGMEKPITVLNSPTTAEDAPSWSPDGKTLVFTSYDPQDPLQSGLYRYDFTSSVMDRVGSPWTIFDDRDVWLFGQHTVWADDRHLLLPQQMALVDAFTGEVKGLYRDRIVDLVEGTAYPLTDVPGERSFGFPPFPISADFSQDGTLMVFDGVTSQIGESASISIFTANADGSGATRLSLGFLGNDTERTYYHYFSITRPAWMAD